MKLFLQIVVVSYISSFVLCNHNLRYRKMQFSSGRRSPNFPAMSNRGYEYPQPLPTPSPFKGFRRLPYPSLYQGSRSPGDKRVFRKSFSYPATDVGHRIITDNLMDCIITSLAVETEANLPIILRGGVGYRHFTVVVRAQPFEPLEGTVRAYCRPRILDE